MADLSSTNPVILNVPAPAVTSGLPTPGPSAYAIPHVGAPPSPVATAHIPGKTAYANPMQKKE